MSHGHNALVFILTRRRLSSFSTLALRLPTSRTVLTRQHVTPLFLLERLPERSHTPLVPSTPTSTPTPRSHNVSNSSTRVSNDAPSKTTHSAIHFLQRFLSPQNVTSQRPLTYSPSYLRSLYYMAESENHLGQLDAQALTVLMGLFGSLSIDPSISVVYRVPLASHFVESSTRTHWCFVLKVGEYKLHKGMSLQDSDRFWLMRAELANAEASSRTKPLPKDARKAISRARTHYHIIRRHTRHPEVHAVYFETLLATRDSQLLDIVASDLAFLLRTHPTWHPRLLRVLCRLVIQHGARLSTRSRDTILSAFWNRVCGLESTSKLPATHGQDNYCAVDASVLARSLSTCLSGLSSLSSAGWFDHLFRVFSPVHPNSTRWSSLVFFAIFNAVETPHANDVSSSPQHMMPLSATCWQVVFGLGIIQKVLRQPLSASEGNVTAGDALEMTRSLYHSWVPIVKANKVPRDLAGAIATSFLNIADQLTDTSLFNSCRALYNMADPGPTHTCPLPLARYGTLDEAFQFLDGERFSAEERGILVHAIARNIMTRPRTRYPPGIFTRITNELIALYRSHPPTDNLRAHLEQLLVFLVKRGGGIEPTRLVLSIIERLPAYFKPRFFLRLGGALIRHGQFAAAERLITAIITMCPKVGQSLRFLLKRTTMRARMSRAIRRTVPLISSLRGPASLRLSSCLRRCSHVSPSPERMLQELLASGRVLAAKSLFARAVPTLSPDRCTAMGNILLHGVSCQPTPRNGRRVRKVLALLEHLVENHGFRPDRVTVNIVVKVLISWRHVFDASRLRGLFDQLVRGGYPAGDYSPQRPPFGTACVETSSSFRFPKFRELISFERHLRPLYKMFIKAFYLRHDVDAARKVVGILKVEEYMNAVEKKARRKARQQGRVRALLGGHDG